MNSGLTLAQVALPQSRAATHAVARLATGMIAHAQWVRKVQSWCAALQQVPGQDVALYLDDPLDFAAALWGAWHAGKTPVLLGDAQPQTLAQLLPQVSACVGQLPGSIGPALVAAVVDAVALQPLDMAKVRVVLFTSGSTGAPERIEKHLAQLDAEVHALQSVFGADISAEDVQVLATVSHHHIYGLLFRVLWPLSAGRLLGTGFARYPEELVQLLKATPSSLLVSSPALLGRLPVQLDWPGAAKGLRGVFSSGGPLSAEASAHAQQLLGQSPTEVFGSSETGGIAWRRRAEQGDTWQALPGVALRVQGNGQLAVRSAHLPDASSWWETVDCVEASGDGHSFVLLGRSDRVVKIAEKRVSLTAMERCLQAHAWVQQARAVVLEGGDSSGRVGMVAELSEAGWQALQQQGRRATGRALRAVLAEVVELVALPRSWRYVAQLPVNAQSKTTLHSLQTLFNPVVPQPEWLERSATQATAQLQVQPQLRVLEGHFPGAALVPGVAQLHWVVSLGTQAFGLSEQFADAQLLKFQQPILPGDTVQLQLQWQSDSGTLQFVLSSDRGTHASGKLKAWRA
ncbi:AMP-binding protein [Comamonas thiooxydans]|uniref:AMP-binding protein n=1 Tax=Comamonas thiooxydans TaxID=363952 RepID=UPI0021147E04|nr:AMP-binding protein [Comamonas thiooxydans]UUE92319.1 AMP-binding protein [Comamonas thiooxydans]